MSYDTDRYRLPRQSERLTITECGIQICHPGHAAPMLKYREYSAHFILEGAGVYEIGGNSYPLEAGDGFMITPGAVCSYTADEKRPWKYVYVSFMGREADAIAESAGISEKNVIFHFPADDAMRRDIYALHAAGKQSGACGYDVLGYFLLVMSRLIKKSAPQKIQERTGAHYVHLAKQYVEDNYPYEIGTAEIAYHVCLERSYLYRLFIKEEGISPSRYLLRYRMQKAASLLLQAERSISEIAAAVGIPELSHFYKAFKGFYGITPKKYRELQKSI